MITKRMGGAALAGVTWLSLAGCQPSGLDVVPLTYGPLKGRLVDDAGKPLVGVTLMASGGAYDQTPGPGKPAPMQDARIEGRFRGTSGSDGSFMLEASDTKTNLFAQDDRVRSGWRLLKADVAVPSGAVDVGTLTMPAR